MSILKKIRKQQQPADLAGMAKIVANVKKLIDMKVLVVNMEKPEISLYPEIWIGKDQKYKTNFCKNVLVWRSITLKDGHTKHLQVLNIETGEKIGEYLKEVGYINNP